MCYVCNFGRLLTSISRAALRLRFRNRGAASYAQSSDCRDLAQTPTEPTATLGCCEQCSQWSIHMDINSTMDLTLALISRCGVCVNTLNSTGVYQELQNPNFRAIAQPSEATPSLGQPVGRSSRARRPGNDDVALRRQAGRDRYGKPRHPACRQQSPIHLGLGLEGLTQSPWAHAARPRVGNDVLTAARLDRS
jgi:hypothetical protein